MTLPLASRARALRPSPTLAVGSKARLVAESGRRVVSFAAGEPDFDTPRAVCEAAERAMRAGMTRYTPSAGTAALREAIAAKFVRENGLAATASNVMATCGAKQAIYNAMCVLLDPGDEVIVPAPCWPTYLDQAELVGARAVPVPCRAEDGYALDLDAIEAAVGPRSRAIVLNSPCNPTGAAYTEEQVASLGQIASRHGLWIISDEIYERIRYGSPHVSAARLCDPEQTVTVSGCSKSFAMTGWRIGFAHAVQPVVDAMVCVQDQVTSNPTSFAQAGAVAALGLPSAEVEAMTARFCARRDLMLELLASRLGLEVRAPEGAFYVLADVRRWAGEDGDKALADRLLDQAGVAAVPGSFFLAPGTLRLSYATSEEDIDEGTAKMAAELMGERA